MRRWRGLLALALTSAACAQVVGLSELEIVDAADASPFDGASSSLDSSQPSSTSDGADTESDAAVDAAVDAAPPSRDGVPCSTTLLCGSSDTSTPPCCISFNPDGGAGFVESCTAVATCNSNGGFPFPCDDHTDCPTGEVCCVSILTSDAGNVTPFQSVCAQSCAIGADTTIACLSDGECGGGTCVPNHAVTENLPLLALCQ